MPQLAMPLRQVVTGRTQTPVDRRGARAARPRDGARAPRAQLDRADFPAGGAIIRPLGRGYSSAGRALAWHARGQRFDPAYLHQPTVARSNASQSPSSRGLGHRPFTAVTGVRIPVGTPPPFYGRRCTRFFAACPATDWKLIGQLLAGVHRHAHLVDALPDDGAVAAVPDLEEHAHVGVLRVEDGQAEQAEAAARVLLHASRA